MSENTTERRETPLAEELSSNNTSNKIAIQGREGQIGEKILIKNVKKSESKK